MIWITIALLFIFAGCEENNNAINNEAEAIAFLLWAGQNMGCFYQGDCQNCIPSTFIKSPSISREDCPDEWMVRPLFDPVCLTGISGKATIGDVTTYTYKTGCE